jgi:predicted transcriptional regulator
LTGILKKKFKNTHSFAYNITSPDKEAFLNNDEIRRFIAEKGYRTMAEIAAQFNGDQEMLAMNLTFLVEKNMVRKAKIQTPVSPEDLYYIPCSQK